MGLFTRKTDAEKIARIARNANGPAARQLAWEGWWAAWQELWPPAVQGYGGDEAGKNFDAWWASR